MDSKIRGLPQGNSWVQPCTLGASYTHGLLFISKHERRKVIVNLNIGGGLGGGERISQIGGLQQGNSRVQPCTLGSIFHPWTLFISKHGRRKVVINLTIGSCRALERKSFYTYSLTLTGKNGAEWSTSSLVLLPTLSQVKNWHLHVIGTPSLFSLAPLMWHLSLKLIY